MYKIYVVSTGAGGTSYLTLEAIEVLNSVDVVVGYTKYIEELQPILKDKITITSNMTEEIERCNSAIESALSGKKTAIISNGDVNVFAMASLVVELVDEKNLWDKIEVVSIAGVTSLLATASKVGAPISQDFAVISLSDRLTPLEVIDSRINRALEGDFVIGIYNPVSKKRKKPYEMLLDHLKNYNNKIVIIASNIGREDEKITIQDTIALLAQGVDNPLLSMSSLIIIGNDQTRLTKINTVLTPRGYMDKYDLNGDKK